MSKITSITTKDGQYFSVGTRVSTGGKFVSEIEFLSDDVIEVRIADTTKVIRIPWHNVSYWIVEKGE